MSCTKAGYIRPTSCRWDLLVSRWNACLFTMDFNSSCVLFSPSVFSHWLMNPSDARLFLRVTCYIFIRFISRDQNLSITVACCTCKQRQPSQRLSARTHTHTGLICELNILLCIWDCNGCILGYLDAIRGALDETAPPFCVNPTHQIQSNPTHKSDPAHYTGALWHLQYGKP